MIKLDLVGRRARLVRIICQMEDGTPRILDLVAPIEIRQGAFLNRITDGTGSEHFFTEEGHYDGWGRSI